MKNDLFLELIITNKCNIRCPFCSVELGNKSMSSETLNNFHLFLRENREKIGNLIIDFFGGEPMIEFEKIKYFINQTNDLNIKYIIGTNAFYLDDEKIDFFHKNKVEIVVSVSSQTEDWIFKKIKKYSRQIFVNLVIIPREIEKYLDIFKRLYNIGIKNLFILPAFGILSWSESDLKDFEKFIFNIKEFRSAHKNENLRIETLRYYHQETLEKEFMIDWDGNVYFDKDPCLFLLENKVKLIKIKKPIGSIANKTLDINKLINKNGIKIINNDKKIIAEKLCFLRELIKINKILDLL
ncbi:radical SAM protein [Candidatus Parcubacteria bacterium]|nr:radical SAM protein [Candidatus Parcubacteria bacterium]